MYHTYVYATICVCLPTASHAPIRTQDLSAHVEKLFANDKYGFSEEYKVTANKLMPPYLTCTDFNTNFILCLCIRRRYKKHHPNMKVKPSVCR